jgi:membrane associated rhomboid family serine protease
MFNHFSPSPCKHQPLFSIGRSPVTLVTLLIGIHLLVMVLTVLCISLGHASWVNALCYSSNAVWQGQVLRLVTYAFVNPPSIWFALDMLMLYYFGREVERLLGYKKFALLYIGLILTGSCMLQLVSLGGISEKMSGGQSVNFAIFAAFVAIYPELPFLFGIGARWMLVALVALATLQFLEARQFTFMMIFLLKSLGAILFMIAQGYRGLLPDYFGAFLLKFSQRFSFSSQRKGVGLSSSSRVTSSSASVIEACSTTASFVPVFTDQKQYGALPRPVHAPIINIDRLLEKISQNGLESLTVEEKKELEQASNALVERDRSA